MWSWRKWPKWDRPGQQASENQVRQALLDLRVRQVRQAQWVRQARRASQDQRELQVLWVPLALSVRPVPLARPALPDHKENEDLKALQDLQANKVLAA